MSERCAFNRAFTVYIMLYFCCSPIPASSCYSVSFLLVSVDAVKKKQTLFPKTEISLSLRKEREREKSFFSLLFTFLVLSPR